MPPRFCSAWGFIASCTGETPFDAGVAWNLAGAALCGVTIYTLGSAPSLENVADWIDRRAHSHDRFHTALAFAARPELTSMESLTLVECAGYVERFPVRRWTPIRLPRPLLFAVVPLISLALLTWHTSLGIGEPPRDPALDAAVARRADTLEKMADRLHQDDKRAATPDLDKIADAMKRSAERLKDSAREGDERKLKTALGEISSLEADAGRDEAGDHRREGVARGTGGAGGGTGGERTLQGGG